MTSTKRKGKMIDPITQDASDSEEAAVDERTARMAARQMAAQHAEVRTAMRTGTGLLSAIRRGGRRRGKKSNDDDDSYHDEPMVGDVDDDDNGDTGDDGVESNPFADGSEDDSRDDGDRTKSIEPSSEEEDASNDEKSKGDNNDDDEEEDVLSVEEETPEERKERQDKEFYALLSPGARREVMGAMAKLKGEDMAEEEAREEEDSYQEEPVVPLASRTQKRAMPKTLI
jgi:hypothetical protein